MKLTVHLLSMLLLIGTAACVEPYTPPASHNTPDYLVVDGFIYLGGDSVAVKLSHTVALNSTEASAAETGSTVLVEDDAGASYPLDEYIAGTYKAFSVPLTTSHTYRLIIRTTTHKEYHSQYITLKPSPPIDNLYWTASRNGDGVRINVDTHDATGSSRYYRWRFTETWEYNASYYSSYLLADGEAVPRPESESINTCWRTGSSATILVGTSNRLSGDVIHQFPLQHIPKASIKLSKKYSIQVEQQVLSDEAYAYWLSLQRSTETLGSLFDPLPSQAHGNLYCVDTPSEAVIGYFGGGSVAVKRVYILRDDIPSELRSYYPAVCPIDTVFMHELPLIPRSTLLLSPVTAPNGVLLGYTTSDSQCVDCRVWGGGVTQKPDFWQ